MFTKHLYYYDSKKMIHIKETCRSCSYKLSLYEVQNTWANHRPLKLQRLNNKNLISGESKKQLTKTMFAHWVCKPIMKSLVLFHSSAVQQHCLFLSVWYVCFLLTHLIMNMLDNHWRTVRSGHIMHSQPSPWGANTCAASCHVLRLSSNFFVQVFGDCCSA